MESEQFLYLQVGGSVEVLGELPIVNSLADQPLLKEKMEVYDIMHVSAILFFPPKSWGKYFMVYGTLVGSIMTTAEQ